MLACSVRRDPAGVQALRDEGAKARGENEALRRQVEQ